MTSRDVPPEIREAMPSVAGRFDRTLADFERSCLVHLDEEQRRPNPDSALIAVLCDAVRLVREHAEVLAHGRQEAREHKLFVRAMMILKALDLSVQWELAPSIMKALGTIYLTPLTTCGRILSSDGDGRRRKPGETR